MPDAEQAVVAIVASHVVDAPAAAADALDVAALPRLATTLSAFDAFSAPRLAFIAAAPSRALVARGAADDGLDTASLLDLGDCGEQPFAATASAGPALQALCARCPVVAQAPTSFIRRLASDPDALGRFTEAVASSTTREAAAGRGFKCSAFDAPTLHDARYAPGALDVYDATAGTVLDRPTAMPFAGDAPPAVSLLLARGADARYASRDNVPLYLAAGALGSSSTEADPPDGAAAADGSTNAIDANGAAVSTTTTTAAASALPPELKTRYEATLTTLKDIRNNIRKTGHHGGDGFLRTRLDTMARGIETPCGKPMGRKATYMIRRYWEKEPGKKTPSCKFLKDTPFLAALITELEAFLGLQPSTVDEALDDDDDAEEEAVPEASLAEAKRWLDHGTLKSSKMPSAKRLKEICDQFKVDYSQLRGIRKDIKRKLVARLKEIVADGEEELSVDARAKVVTHLIAKEAKGSGLDADEDEFHRVLWFVTCAGRAIPLEIVLRNDFLSAALACLQKTLPSSESDAPPPAKVPRTAASDLDSELWEKIWTLLDGKDADALRVASRAGHAAVPQRIAVSTAVRRQAVVNEDTDPKSRLTMLRPEFLAVDVHAPKDVVLAAVDDIAEGLFLRPGKRTVDEDMVGRATSPGELLRDIANNVPCAALELAQLCLPTSQRDPFFKRWTNGDVGCTTNTQIKMHSVQKLLEHHVDGILRGETEHDLDEVVSTPSAKQESTLRLSLATWRGASKAKRAQFMSYLLTHSTKAAVTIIRDASEAIEARLAELTKDYPAEFDKAVKFFLKRFKPKDDAEAAEAAAWRSWLEDPLHVAAVARKATGGAETK